MVDERKTWTIEEPAKASKATEAEPVTTQATKPAGGMREGMEKTIRATWTILCFLVFCGFSFFMGWHLKGWHFSAYYESPANGSYLGAKPASISVPVEPDPQISQASPGNKQ